MLLLHIIYIFCIDFLLPPKKTILCCLDCCAVLSNLKVTDSPGDKHLGGKHITNPFSAAQAIRLLLCLTEKVTLVSQTAKILKI